MSNFRFNDGLNRYELEKDGHVAFANVRRVDGVLHIDYVEAPHALRGTGAAGELMRALADDIKTKGGLKMHPICGYAASWLRKHTEYADLMTA